MSTAAIAETAGGKLILEDIWDDLKLAAILAAAIILFPIIAALLIIAGADDDDPYT